MPYAIEIAPAAARQLKALPQPIQTQIIRRLEKLEADPRLAGVEKIKGADNLYRVRSGDYRILYAIQDRDLIVMVVKIGDRKDIYRRLPK